MNLPPIAEPAHSALTNSLIFRSRTAFFAQHSTGAWPAIFTLGDANGMQPGKRVPADLNADFRSPWLILQRATKATWYRACLLRAPEFLSRQRIRTQVNAFSMWDVVLGLSLAKLLRVWERLLQSRQLISVRTCSLLREQSRTDRD